MAPRLRSAGILAFRFRDKGLEVFLIHPGGPYWKGKETGAWSIPKGEYRGDADPLAAARREFAEETGAAIDGEFHPLPSRKLRSGKVVDAWAIEADIDVSRVRSNTFAMEWPPGSGVEQEFPEVDRAAWFAVSVAMRMINAGQRGFLEDLQHILAP